MQNYLVSRLPEFIGKDGRIYNAVWGPITVLKSILEDNNVLQVGNSYFSGVNFDTLSVVACDALPKTTGIYYKDTRLVAVYDAT